MTLGHVDVLEGALTLADEVVVAIGIHPGKTPLFSFEARKRMIEEAMGSKASRLNILSFEGLLVDVASAHGASLIVRGLRDGTDFDYEMQMVGMNGVMRPEVRTVFVPASPQTRHITATLVRQIAAMGGDIAPFVPENVAAELRKRFKKPQ